MRSSLSSNLKYPIQFLNTNKIKIYSNKHLQYLWINNKKVKFMTIINRFRIKIKKQANRGIFIKKEFH